MLFVNQFFLEITSFWKFWGCGLTQSMLTALRLTLACSHPSIVMILWLSRSSQEHLYLMEHGWWWGLSPIVPHPLCLNFHKIMNTCYRFPSKSNMWAKKNETIWKKVRELQVWEVSTGGNSRGGGGLGAKVVGMVFIGMKIEHGGSFHTPK